MNVNNKWYADRRKPFTNINNRDSHIPECTFFVFWTFPCTRISNVSGYVSNFITVCKSNVKDTGIIQRYFASIFSRLHQLIG